MHSLSPEKLCWIQVQKLAGPIKVFGRVFLKPLLCVLGHILWVVVLLKCKLLCLPENFSTADTVTQDCPMFFYIFPLIQTSLKVPVAEKKHPHSSVFDCRDSINEVMLIAWFPPHKPEDFASYGLQVVQVPSGKLSVGCHLHFSDEWLLSGHSTMKAWSGECCTSGCSSLTAWWLWTSDPYIFGQWHKFCNFVLICDWSADF